LLGELHSVVNNRTDFVLDIVQLDRHSLIRFSQASHSLPLIIIPQLP